MSGFHTASLIEAISQRQAADGTKLSARLARLEEQLDTHYPIESLSVRPLHAGGGSLEGYGWMEALAYEMLEFNSILREVGDLSCKIDEENKYLEVLAKCPSEEAATVVSRALELQDELDDALRKRREAKLEHNRSAFKHVHTRSIGSSSSQNVEGKFKCGGACGTAYGTTCIKCLNSGDTRG